MNPYVGEIRMFAGNFAPQGWAFCSGQLLAISEFEDLFNLIGTTYGGDGESTFAVPNLQGRFPLHMGEGFTMGQDGGVEDVTLTLQQIPVHSHRAACGAGAGNSGSPAGKYWSTDPFGGTAAYKESGGATMAGTAIESSGGGQPHNNMSPFLCVTFIIALEGIFPSQT